ncbi:MAG: hypothetical protein WCC31_17075, partial [Terracidiphilus sp.]
ADVIEATDFLSHPFGQGMGTGAAAVTKLMNIDILFVAGEGEFGRLMYEIGPFPGFFFMTFRFLLAAFVAVSAIGQARRHEPLALLLVPVMYTSLFLFVLEQPTGQGFMVMSLAFSLAALKRPEAARFRVPQAAVLRFSSPRPQQRAR